MKKNILCLVLTLIFISSLQVSAKTNPPPRTYGYYHSHHSSSPNYVVRSDYQRDEHNFVDCDKHSLIKETTVNYYSNGNKFAYSYYTILTSGGTILESDCTDVKHTIFENKHYIIFKKGKYYKIMDGDGKIISNRNYSYLSEISKNRWLAKVDKKFGVIDLNEKIIVPIKYKSFEKISNNLFITNLNGYYGIQDADNNIYVKNEFDKITPLYDTYVLKKMGKYGLADINAKVILDTAHDDIKSLGEYILIKKDNKCGLLDFSGIPITKLEYKKFDLKRNVLYGKTTENKWIKIFDEI